MKDEDEIRAKLAQVQEDIERVGAALQAADNADLVRLAELERRLIRWVAWENALSWVLWEIEK